jgi:DNA-directed RNA polymerase specialized sigma24 family protein
MSEEPSFRELIQRVRAGDSRAAAELVRQYEPTVRLVVRRRLTDPALRRVFDSMDVCQSVLASFFVRVGAGEYEIDQPGQLLRLLAAMARNKLATQVAHQRAARRDVRRVREEVADDVRDSAAGPGEVAANRELLREVRRRLSAEEGWLADQRGLGREWVEIAAEVGATPDGLRMRFSRAITRVSRELGLGD